MRRDVDERVAALATSQHLVFSRAQALAAGASPQAIDNRVRSGAWLVTSAATYRERGSPLTWRGSLAASLLDAGDAALVSDAAAARLHRFPTYVERPVEILVPYGLDHECAIATVHETRRFDAVPETTVDNLRTTSPEATLFHLARDLRLGRLGWLTDELLAAGLVEFGLLEATLKALGGRGVPGSGVFRKVLEERRPGQGMPASFLERLFIREAQRSGFPVGEREMPLPGRQDGPERVDFLYRLARLIIEVDGRRWHTRVRDFDRDRERDLVALAAGYRTARVSSWMLRHEPVETFAMLRRTLAAAA